MRLQEITWHVPSEGRPGVTVRCIVCHLAIGTRYGGRGDYGRAFADLDGPPFLAYYHEGCLPKEERDAR